MQMQGLTLTKNFLEKWEEQVGNFPTVQAVHAYLSQSVLIQRCEDFLRQDGTPFRMLAIYWHPELDLVIKVDTEERAAVTVYARERYVKRPLDVGRPLRSDVGRQRPEDVPRPTSNVQRGLMARIARVRERFGLCRAARGGEA